MSGHRKNFLLCNTALQGFQMIQCGVTGHFLFEFINISMKIISFQVKRIRKLLIKMTKLPKISGLPVKNPHGQSKSKFCQKLVLSLAKPAVYLYQLICILIYFNFTYCSGTSLSFSSIYAKVHRMKFMTNLSCQLFKLLYLLSFHFVGPTGARRPLSPRSPSPGPPSNMIPPPRPGRARAISVFQVVPIFSSYCKSAKFGVLLNLADLALERKSKLLGIYL